MFKKENNRDPMEPKVKPVEAMAGSLDSNPIRPAKIKKLVNPSIANNEPTEVFYALSEQATTATTF